MLTKTKRALAALPLLLLISSSIQAQEGRNIFRIKDASAAKLSSLLDTSQSASAEEESVSVSPLSPDTNGWTYVATFDGNRISDEEWVAARDSMTVGLKIIVDEQNVIFFEANDLRSARCISISDVDSLRASNNFNGMAFFHDEPDCDDVGGDYTYLFYTYGNNHYWNLSNFPVAYTETWSGYQDRLDLSGKSIYIK